MTKPIECYIASEADPNLVLEVEGGSLEKKARVILYSFHGSANQRWIVSGNSLLNANSHLALDVCGGEQRRNQIIQYPSHGGSNQTWHFYESDHSIRSQQGLCLDICGGDIRSGTPIIAYEPRGTLNQRWKLIPVNKKEEIPTIFIICVNVDNRTSIHQTLSQTIHQPPAIVMREDEESPKIDL